MITGDASIIVGRDSRGYIILDMMAPQSLDVNEARMWLASQIARVDDAVAQGSTKISLNLSCRVTFGRPADADHVADELFNHANDDDLNDRAYGPEIAMDRADAMRDWDREKMVDSLIEEVKKHLRGPYNPDNHHKGDHDK